MRIGREIDSNFGIAFGIAGCYAAGLVYGAITRVNRTMAANAFAITIATKMAFDAIANLATGGKEDNPKAFYTTHLVGDALLAAVHIVAFRHLKLMGTLGTAFFSFAAFIIVLENLRDLKKA